jgi:capsular polysaccharide biosynthesis protein/tRNA A-37 threonylcarbamoyl transferase component Bud32
METERICPSCRKPLAPDAPLGLCPDCLIKAGLNPATDPGDPSLSAAGFVPPPVEELARLFPQLEIIEFVGKGGMGAVYKARQPKLDRFVALKILPPAAAGDPGFAERFNREARALARLNHPNIVAVHDFGHAGVLHYLVMEFVDGGNLRQIEAAGRLTSEQALAIVPQICDALQFAHNEGIVHRDIKPENLLLDKKGRVKITDFGIAKMLGLTAGQTTLTGARDVVGTPHYMAPEQLEKPQTVDHRADIYSLGVVFYEMLTGELPLGRFAPPSRKVQVDVRLDEVVLHALEKEPELRYQQASQVKTAVETIAASPSAQPPGSVAASPEHPAPPPDAAALTEQILARDYDLNIRDCLRRGWELVRSDFWPIVGVSALVLALLWAASSSEPIFSYHRGGFHATTSLLGVLLGGPLMGGLYLFFLKKIRGELARVETAFAGFSSRFLQLFLASFVSHLLLGLGFICLVLPFIYLLVAWIFTLPLVIDKRLEFWPAMQLSRKTVSKHWWKFLGFGIVLVLFNLLGVLLLCVGVFLTFPISLAALMYAYEDIFTAAETSAEKPARYGSTASAEAQLHAHPRRLTAILVVLLAAFAVVCVSSALGTLSTYRTFLVAFAAAVALGAASVLLIRKLQPAGHFIMVFLVAFLVVFGAGSFITSVLPNSFASTARIVLTPNAAESTGAAGAKLAASPYDPYRIQTELEVIQSKAVLDTVIEALDLTQKWGKSYAGSGEIKRAEALDILKQRLNLRLVRNANIVEIRVFDDKADEAANIANEIAKVYRNRTTGSDTATSTPGAFQVEIIDQATPALRPVRPNRPLNLTLAALAGLLLGVAAGAARVTLFGRKKQE